MHAATSGEMLVAAAMLAAVGLALIAFEIMDRRSRRRTAKAWRSYFHEGGLIRTLLSRWSGPARLTDRRDPD
ncbi:MAG TPA: hypothetical protein VF637_04005 [Sphingomicrobium sp.]|jgi:hypothetical protein